MLQISLPGEKFGVRPCDTPTREVLCCCHSKPGLGVPVWGRQVNATLHTPTVSQPGPRHLAVSPPGLFCRDKVKVQLGLGLVALGNPGPGKCTRPEKHSLALSTRLLRGCADTPATGPVSSAPWDRKMLPWQVDFFFLLGDKGIRQADRTAKIPRADTLQEEGSEVGQRPRMTQSMRFLGNGSTGHWVQGRI